MSEQIIQSEVFSKVWDGKVTRTLVYPDDTAIEGYQIVRDTIAAKVGDFVRVGTGYTNGKHTTAKVTRIGKSYDMAVEHGSIDEDHSYSGFKRAGASIVKVKRLYFR